MANLVPVLLDKSTGQFIASSIASGGGGGGGSALQAFGYLFQTSSGPATEWEINHNGNTQFVNVQVYESDGLEWKTLIPDGITIVDLNNIKITFAEAQAGMAVLILFQV